ncbi:MAG: NupC/NupG family nucleoside CNT transporter [Acidobacteriales bacterium]|nr:NupC/NupG family nucleoside CNT transporter [Terriglobales bacterium]
MGRFTGILGILALLSLAYLFSTSRRAVRWGTVAWGLGLQLLFAVIVLRTDYGQRILGAAGAGVNKLLSYTIAGSSFVFGDLGKPGSPGYFAFVVLSTIIFISAFFAVMYHLGIMQLVIRGFAWVMAKTMRVSGAESLNVAASIFMGQTEAPLTIRPFLSTLTRSELMTVMTSGMAHVSGGIMAAYIAAGIEPKHILSSVIMTAPGTILIAKMLVPETEVPETEGRVHLEHVDMHKGENLVGAIARGTTDGLRLAVNVGAILISFLALIALVDGIFGWAHAHFAHFPVSLESLLGVLFRPVAFLIGVPWHESGMIGGLLGTRMVSNELVAYGDLGKLRSALDYRAYTIATYALCGFANLSSIGIQVGGIGALIPERRQEIAALGLRAMLAGTMANLMSASIVSVLLR